MDRKRDTSMKQTRKEMLTNMARIVKRTPKIMGQK